MFVAFLVTYIIILFLGKTIYGILYLIFIMILKLINALITYIKRKAKEAKQRVQNKILHRHATHTIFEGDDDPEKAKEREEKRKEKLEAFKEDSFKSDSSMRRSPVSGLDDFNRHSHDEAAEE